MKKLRLLFSSILFCTALLYSIPPMSAQSLNKMKDERAQLEKQIAESKKLLASTDNNVKGQLSKLSVLSEQIKKQQAIVNSLDKEIKTMNNEIAANEQRQRELELDLSKRKNNYAHALRLSVQKNTFEKRLTFLFSADSFRQMYRRARYLREYSDFQAKQGREIQSKRLELEKKKEELVQLRTEKQTLFTQQQAEQQTLAQQQSEQQKIVKQLQKKQADIKS